MMKRTITGAVAATALLATSPCVAAEDFRSGSGGQARAAAFAGASIRLPLGGKAKAKPIARLQLGMAHHDGRAQARIVPGSLELGIGSKGSPRLLVGGRTPAEMRERLGMAGSTSNTVMIIFGVALLAVGLLVISNLNGLSEDDGN